MHISIQIIRDKFLFLQYAYALTTLLLIQIEYVETSPLMLLLMSVWNIISYAYLFYYETKFAPEFHPFTLLALVSIQYIGINGLSYSLKLFDGEDIIFCGNVVNNYLVLGLWYLSLQHILLFTTYYKVLHKNKIQTKTPFYQYIIRSRIHYCRWALKVYLVLWCIRILDIIISINSYSSFIWNFSRNGQLITLTLLVFEMLRTPQNNKIFKLFWIIVFIEMIWVLGEGSKESIIINLVPYGIYLLIGYKLKIVQFNRKLFITLGSLGVFVIFIVFPYVSVFRDIAIRKNIPWSEVSVIESISEYYDYMIGSGNYENSKKSDKSASYAVDRAGAISCNAWAIDYASKNGPEIKYLILNAVSFIPKFLWPDKPPNITGSMLYHIAYGDPYWEVNSLLEFESGNLQTYVSAGFIGGCYFSLGIIGAIFFSLFAGWFIGMFWVFLRNKIYYNIIAIWSFYSIIIVILKDFEAFDDCGILFYFFSLLYIILIKYIFPFKKYKFMIIK